MSSGDIKTYDLVVIGSGPGGYVAAIRAAQLGLSCALVEKNERFGGTCLNIGCIPSKALLDSSELYARLHDRGAQGPGSHGIKVGKLELDVRAMMQRKNQVVARLTSGIGRLLSGNGVETWRGSGRLAGKGTVEVSLPEGSERALKARHILLATGSVPAALPGLPAGRDGFITSAEALSLQQVPKTMAVIGGGAIGLELGSVWARLGAEVTVIELLDQILPGMDAEISRRLRTSLQKQGLNIVTGTQVLGYRTAGRGGPARGGGGKNKGTGAGRGESPTGGVILEAESSSGEKVEYPAEVVLVAVGRRPYTHGLGLAEAGVQTEERSGKVVVDEGFCTSVSGVYAIGDLVRGPMLAHKAEEEAIAVVESLAGLRGEVRYDTIPSVVYTRPEVASVGRSEEQLKQVGVEYTKGGFPFRANGRALAMDSEEGLVKILADKASDRLLGVHILGPWASELIGEAVSVMEFGGNAEDVARTVHPHPTLSEAVREAALDAGGRAIHLLRARRR